MIIGVDVESGERSYQELVKGSLNALQYLPDISIKLIGDSSKILKSFPHLASLNNVSLVNAAEVILMDEKPTNVLKKKKKSTVAVGINLLKEKKIDVFFSPGNTGATVVSSILNLGMMKGIKRPAMATFFPRIGGGETLIIDIGANVDANEKDLYNNAIMGEAYYKIIHNKSNPTVGLLNMGIEYEKGSVTIKKAFELLKRTLPNFVGNVEGYNVFNGTVDVAVCNGFIGNSILKIAEASKKYFLYALKNIFFNTKNVSFFKRTLLYINSLFGVYTEKKRIINDNILPKYYGAAPLLGVNGLVMIGHGNCSTDELTNAIELANKLYKLDLLNKIRTNVQKFY